jgi:hypothetical protein
VTNCLIEQVLSLLTGRPGIQDASSPQISSTLGLRSTGEGLQPPEDNGKDEDICFGMVRSQRPLEGLVFRLTNPQVGWDKLLTDIS